MTTCCEIMMRAVAVNVLAVICLSGRPGQADETAPARAPTDSVDVVPQVFQQRCVKCHGKGGRVEGKVKLVDLKSIDDLVTKPALVRNLIEVLDTGAMPPEEEPVLDEAMRTTLVARLRKVLHVAVSSQTELPRAPIRRMNRFQYNNAVQDLFQLNVEVFPLPERMLREYGDYFQPQTGKMPEKLTAGCRPLGKSQMIEKCLTGVTPFPQDLRAEHGFDNRGDHLSLSPLLLEYFFKLSRSVVDSADFNPQTCGIWQEFFVWPAEDQAAELATVIRTRLNKFLAHAFRRPAQDALLDRYTDFAMQQVHMGQSFTDSMKSVAAAAIASPQFFYLYDQDGQDEKRPRRLDDFDLASRLSFFLWGSLPDQPLLDLAANRKLHDPDILTQQVQRMLRDRRLKRFCDSFPAQWLQLERILSSAPDPKRYPQFYLRAERFHASMHMLLEPLLLFETVLIEDQSILKFIDSDFSYQSDLLEAWYRDGSQGEAGENLTINFRRVPITDRRQGGVITNAAVMTMTSSANHSKPIARGAWVASVILNDPPEPPPADVPPLVAEPANAKTLLTIRERFAAHRKRADCAGCHRQIDPLGFALENYDAAGIWRDKYNNGRKIDASGILFARRKFTDIIAFKDALLVEKKRFTTALASHLLSFALGRDIQVEDLLALDHIVRQTAAADYRFQTLIKQVVLSEPFRR